MARNSSEALTKAFDAFSEHTRKCPVCYWPGEHVKCERGKTLHYEWHKAALGTEPTDLLPGIPNERPYSLAYLDRENGMTYAANFNDPEAARQFLETLRTSTWRTILGYTENIYAEVSDQ